MIQRLRRVALPRLAGALFFVTGRGEAEGAGVEGGGVSLSSLSSSA
jgi:hypothetical protein